MFLQFTLKVIEWKFDYRVHFELTMPHLIYNIVMLFQEKISMLNLFKSP